MTIHKFPKLQFIRGQDMLTDCWPSPQTKVIVLPDSLRVMCVRDVEPPPSLLLF